MRSLRVCSWALFLLLICVFSAPAWGIESGLLGVQIGATPSDLMETYGPPAGIIFGPNMTFNTTAGAGLFGMAPATTQSGIPIWAKSVWPSGLTANQQMWIYQLKQNVVGGFIIRGLGADATVTDIIAASFVPNKNVETERGLALGDSLAQVLINYGYPSLLQPFAAQVEQAAAAPARALGGSGTPSFGRAGQPMAGGGGMGGGRGRGQGGVGISGRGALAPLAAVRTTTAGSGQVVVVNQQPISFTKNCVVLYDGLALTLYDFKVVRIQITQ